MQPEWWKYVVDLAQILSALGTCGAVLVALFIALMPPKIHLEAWIGLRIIIGMGEERPEYLTMTVTNTGAQAFVLNSVSWEFERVGKIRRRIRKWLRRQNLPLGMQNMGHNDEYVQSSALPIKVESMQTVHYFLPVSGPTSWFEHMKEVDFGSSYKKRKNLEKLRVLLIPSAGKIHRIKPEPKLLDAIWANVLSN